MCERRAARSSGIDDSDFTEAVSAGLRSAHMLGANACQARTSAQHHIYEHVAKTKKEASEFEQEHSVSMTSTLLIIPVHPERCDSISSGRC